MCCVDTKATKTVKLSEHLTVIKVVSFLIGITILGCDAGCPNTIYSMITFRNKLFGNFSRNLQVSSAEECAELCRDGVNCKSFGVSVDPLTCYLYDGRIYAGSPELNVTEIYYFWELEDQCPVNLGYTISSDNSTNTIVCTKYYNNALIWTEGEVQCERDGGHLFIVNSDFRRGILHTYFTSVPLTSPTYIGGNDISRESEWVFLNGDPVNKYFAINKPSSFHTQNCLTFTPVFDGLNDKDCYKSFGFICEVPLVP